MRGGACLFVLDEVVLVVVLVDAESLVGAPQAFSISLLASLAFEVREGPCEMPTIGLTVEGANQASLPLFAVDRVNESCFDGSR